MCLPSCALSLAAPTFTDVRRYDISGVEPERIPDIIERDWIHLLHEKYVLDSPNYLREKGKVVIALWGMLRISIVLRRS